MEEKTAPARNSWIGGMLVGLLILGGSYLLYQFFEKPKAPKKVFAEAFEPPTSLIEDFQKRLAADSTTADESCQRMIASADESYREKKYESAQEPLLMLALDTAAQCQSDAWFYLGLLQLRLDDPELAIQCFTKIENFDRYGQDVQWYIGLAFVKVAGYNPELLPQARRAMQRVRDGSTSEERRAVAEEMLKKL